VPARAPVVLSRDEIGRVLKHVTGHVWLIVVLLYGAGLRVALPFAFESIRMR